MAVRLDKGRPNYRIIRDTTILENWDWVYKCQKRIWFFWVTLEYFHYKKDAEAFIKKRLKTLEEKGKTVREYYVD